MCVCALRSHMRLRGEGGGCTSGTAFALIHKQSATMADPGVARLRIVALMSGTSCDGIDVALCEVQVGPHTLHVALQHFRTLAWPEHTRSALLALVQNPMTEMVPLASIADLNFEAGRALGEAGEPPALHFRCWVLTDFLLCWPVRRFLADVGVRPDEVDCIASHGHTVLHHPPMSTMQIGEPAAVAAATGGAAEDAGDEQCGSRAPRAQALPQLGTFAWLTWQWVAKARHSLRRLMRCAWYQQPRPLAAWCGALCKTLVG